VRTTLLSAVLMVLFLSPSQVFAGTERIVIDGKFSDWDSITPACSDIAGDQSSGEIDFGQLRLASDQDYLFLSLEVGAEINLQGGNGITLYIDTDNNPSTGKRIHDIGAEIEWTFGSRAGYVHERHLHRPINHYSIGLVSAPTVTSTRFEIALDRNGGSVSYRRRFPGPTWRLVIVDEAGGDRVPEAGESVTFVFHQRLGEPLEVTPLGKHAPDHLRLVTYNVLWDGIFDPDRSPALSRILRALRPDIIGFQEVNEGDARRVAGFVRSSVPLFGRMGFGRWYTAKADPQSDVVLVSRFPIRETYPIGMNAAFVIDLRPMYATDLLVILAHPPCCGYNEARQWEIDAIMAFIRQAKAPGGVLTLRQDTPIVIMGDMNLVGYSQQLKTFLTGDIVNTEDWGPSFAPDWDGTDLADLVPRHTDLPMTFTWYGRSESFWPGRLDYIIYTDHVVDVGNNFVLFTPAMSESALDRYRLEPDDATTASDHLPVVCDLILPRTP
jgi:endonuclease/exonuclease/phosphatase family metal-dependent hydrolase